MSFFPFDSFQSRFVTYLLNFSRILAKSFIISFQYNIESVYFFYSNPVLQTETDSKCRRCEPYESKEATLLQDAQYWQNNNI